MRAKLQILTFIVLLQGGISARAAHTTAELVLSAETAKPGDTILAGIHLTMEPEWHTYWRNPGGPGIATTNEWELPKGITAGEIQWPVPNKLEENTITSYAYEGDVLLMVPLKIGAEAASGSIKIKCHVDWLECNSATTGAEKLQCIPGKADVYATLNIGSETKRSDSAGLIEQWQRKLPRPAGEMPASASWEKSGSGDTRPLLIEWNSAQKPSKIDFYPYETELFEISGPVESPEASAGKLRLRVPITKTKPGWPTNISGILVQRTATNVFGFEVLLNPGGGGNGPALWSVGKPGGEASASITLPVALGLAFLGGLILNIMPCVLPVIALKILSFVGEARQHPARVKALGLIYALGVLVSFLVLAVLVIAVKAAGQKAGWGMQFGSPQFILGLTVLITLVALNLFGVFEITLGGKTMDTAGELASRHGAAGAFFNGVLATILGTPCTAAFLGTALGFAFAQPPGIILLVFATVALGLAFPYVLLSWNPAWLAFVPKPGQWMVRFKVAMGFPMLATGFWLFSLLPVHYGDQTWWAGIFLVFVGFAAWAYGEFVQRAPTRRGIGLLFVFVLLATGYGFALEHKLNWRRSTGSAAASQSTSAGLHPAGINWLEWSPEAIVKARSEQRPVIVDFTAQWCPTCNAIVKPALESEAVIKKLQSMNAVGMVGDYTKFPPKISEELARFQRAGVPLVLVYPKNPNAPPIPLPEPSLFPPYSKVILKHLEEAEKM